jgi:two-component system sensor histidine kinase/response regulator
MSHEIRTPMNAIIGITHLGWAPTLTPEQRNRLQKTLAASQHLLGLLNDILDFSKTETGRLTIDVHRSTSTVCSRTSSQPVSSEAPARRASRSCGSTSRPTCRAGCGATPAARADPAQPRRQCREVHRGAARSRSPWRVRAARGHVGMVLRFAVRDTGIGITDDQKARSSGPSNRATTRSRAATAAPAWASRSPSDSSH